MLHEVYHEVQVLIILPIVVASSKSIGPVFKCEELSKFLKEVSEQKVGVDSSLDLDW